MLRFSTLSGRVYLVTRYVVKGNAVVASRKYDVTEEYLALPHRSIARAVRKATAP